MDTKPGYLLITPLKNEEKNIEKLIRSVENQTIKPVLWVIVDDNSEDKSPDLLSKYSKGKNYIHITKFPEKKEWDIGIHYSEVCRYGFQRAIISAEKNKVKYEYIALLDADIILDEKFFEILIKKMEEDTDLGILSGIIYSWNGKKYIREFSRKDLPRGAARIWKKECFEETSGYLSTYSPDAVSNLKAEIHGWKIGVVEEAKAYQVRLTSSAIGTWKGFMKKGIGVYHTFYPPHIALVRGISICILRGIKEGIAFILGYFKAWVNKWPRIEDEEIKKYNKKRHRDIINYWLKK